MIGEQDNSFQTPEPEGISSQTVAIEWPEAHQLELLIQSEFRKISVQQSFYLGLMACALCVFAVVLFLNARHYHNLTLWGVGVCLLVFGLIQFLELDFAHNRKGILQKMLMPQKPSQD